jgi:hypothetical protein
LIIIQILFRMIPYIIFYHFFFSQLLHNQIPYPIFASLNYQILINYDITTQNTICGIRCLTHYYLGSIPNIVHCMWQYLRSECT